MINGHDINSRYIVEMRCFLSANQESNFFDKQLLDGVFVSDYAQYKVCAIKKNLYQHVQTSLRVQFLFYLVNDVFLHASN